MKWIKTHDGNIVRLGAITEFIPNKYGIDILIGEKKIEKACLYDVEEQVSDSYKKLLQFIQDKDTNNEIFNFPSIDENKWLEKYDISELELSVREYNACVRSGIKTIYDLMPTGEGWEKVIRGLGEKTLKELRRKRDEFVKKQRGDENEQQTTRYRI